MSGFWSYVHRDDTAEAGRIQRLAHDLVDQYELITGDDVELFLDKDDLGIGDLWQSRINQSLLSVAFFVPVITPRYLLSPECRRELNYFSNRASKVGASGVILPLIYVTTPSLENPASSDELVQLLRQIHRVDWSRYRLLETDCYEYRSAVARLAQDIARTNAESEVSLSSTHDHVPDSFHVRSGAGHQLEALETARPILAGALSNISDEVSTLAVAVSCAGAEMQEADARGEGFAGRVVIYRRLASELAAPAERILALSSTLTATLNDMDNGIRTLLEASDVDASHEPGQPEQLVALVTQIKALTAYYRESLDRITEKIQNIVGIGSLSRDLHPAFRLIRQGLSIIAEGREVIDEWDRLIESTRLAAATST